MVLPMSSGSLLGPKSRVLKRHLEGKERKGVEDGISLRDSGQHFQTAPLMDRLAV